MDIKQALRIGGCFLTRIDQVDDSLLLRWRELGTATANVAFSAGGQQAAAGVLVYHGALEFGKRSHDLHHHALGRRGGVDSLGQAEESRARLFHRLLEGQHVLERA